jgi:hypothetical protein
MAKQYTRAEWARIQSRLPEEDRVPYTESPEKFDTPADVRARTQRFAEVIEPGVTESEFPTSVTQPRVTAPAVSTATSTESSDALYDAKRRFGYGIDEQGKPITPTKVSGPRTQGLPEGFIAGPFPKELEKLFGAPGDILGYRINTETDKDGKTYFTLSVAQKGAYGEGVTGFSTFGAPFTRDASGNYIGFSPNRGSTTATTATTATTSNAGMTYTASDGKKFTNADAYVAYQANLDSQKANRQSAYDLLFQQFDTYGLGALVTPLKGLIESGISPSEFTIKLRETDAYKQRFAANAQRINKGLRALSEAEYIGLEDQYQDVMRRYGLPASYYSRGDMGRQEGFEKFIGGDVSPVELEDRVQTAQRRVLNAAPQVRDALTQFYGAEIGNGDILAYVLDPEKAIENIKRKVTAAEIGAGAMQAGLATGLARAEELQRFGVTGEQARTGYQAIGGFLPRASQLGDIYAKQGMGPFTQTTAEEEVFGTTGAVEAGRKRRQLAQLEQAQFSGSAGTTGGALARERAGQF